MILMHTKAKWVGLGILPALLLQYCPHHHSIGLALCDALFRQDDKFEQLAL